MILFLFIGDQDNEGLSMWSVPSVNRAIIWRVRDRLFFLGRATIYGVTAGGLRGAKRAISLLQSDLEYTMAMIGTRTVADITRDHVAP